MAAWFLSARRRRFFCLQRKGSDCGGWPIWTLAGIGLVGGFVDSDEHVAIAAFLLGFLFFSALALCPGFYFRLHYFILVLPAVSLLAGVAISRLLDLSD